MHWLPAHFSVAVVRVHSLSGCEAWLLFVFCLFAVAPYLFTATPLVFFLFSRAGPADGVMSRLLAKRLDLIVFSGAGGEGMVSWRLPSFHWLPIDSPVAFVGVRFRGGCRLFTGSLFTVPWLLFSVFFCASSAALHNRFSRSTSATKRRESSSSAAPTPTTTSTTSSGYCHN